MKKIVIALGGNALQEAGKPATAEAQLEVVEKTSEYIADIIGEGMALLFCCHGNSSIIPVVYGLPDKPANTAITAQDAVHHSTVSHLKGFLSG